MKRASKPPVYSQHSSGQARCRIDGEVRYLGTFGSAGSHETYAPILQDWQRSNEWAPRELTVRALAVLFMKFSCQHYRTTRGKETGEAQNDRDALKLTMAMYGSLPASQFSPLKLKAIRERMIADGLARSTINGQFRRLKAVWSWAVSEELIRADLLIGIRTVKGLQRGRTAAREAKPVALWRSRSSVAPRDTWGNVFAAAGPEAGHDSPETSAVVEYRSVRSVIGCDWPSLPSLAPQIGGPPLRRAICSEERLGSAD